MKRSLAIILGVSLLVMTWAPYLSADTATGQVEDQSPTSEKPPRLKSIGGFEIAFGAAWPFTNALQSYKTMYNFILGYTWDIRLFLIELAGHFQAGYNEVDMGTASMAIGLHRILFDRRTTALYVGPDFGFATVNDTGTHSKSGFGFGGNVGLIFFRQADINMDLRFRVLTLADKLNGAVPVTGALSVGIRF